jgi:hypothetical protein
VQSHQAEANEDYWLKGGKEGNAIAAPHILFFNGY